MARTPEGAEAQGNSHGAPRQGAVIMIQGTSSSVGKSLVVAGLCRLLKRRGLSVAPFKAQNLALNSYVTREGGEIGRAQATQAQAAGIEPTVDMNPLLLKPGASGIGQVILMGRPYVEQAATDPDQRKRMLSGVVAECLGRLRSKHDVVVIEGAGSPAEINLRERDIVNMHVAKLARAPVLLVGDISRGGVFAHFVGTLDLLHPEECRLVAGLVINKFHGDVRLLDSAVGMVEERTGVPLLGILPYIENLRMADEDSVALEQRQSHRGPDGDVDIAIVRFPRLSNFDDFLALEHEAGVTVRYVDSPADIEQADLVILPGTKDTRGDLRWLRTRRLDTALLERARSSAPILGVCGGYQMLGLRVEDPEGVEGQAGTEVGLGLLPVRTRFRSAKTTVRVRATVNAACAGFLTEGVAPGETVDGYEIHNGNVQASEEGPWLFQRADQTGEGLCRGSVAGTLMHGLFDNDALRGRLLTRLGRDPQTAAAEPHRAMLDKEYDRLADVLEANLDLGRVEALLDASRLGTFPSDFPA